MSAIPSLSLGDARVLTVASLRADLPIHWIGAPGVGKSSVIRALARACGMPCEALILSQCDPSDLGGIPVPREDRVLRLPVGPVARACEAPAILFLDEFLSSPPSLQAASLTLVLERWAGDARLHPETRVVLASNPPEQGAGGHEQSLPALGRATQLRIEPDPAEVRAYLADLGAVRADGPPEDLAPRAGPDQIRAWGADYAITSEVAPDLVQIDPPPGAHGLAPYPSPRSIERACRLAAEVEAGGIGEGSPVLFAALAGSLGCASAASYLAIRRIRTHLATPAEILADPESARLPATREQAIGALGVVVGVARVDACAAWIYADRMRGPEIGEIRPVLARVLTRYGIAGARGGPRKVRAQQAHVRLLGEAGAGLTGL